MCCPLPSWPHLYSTASLDQQVAGPRAPGARPSHCPSLPSGRKGDCTGRPRRGRREGLWRTRGLFLTLVYLKNKKPKKKKNQLYIQSQTETTDYGKRRDLWGEQGKRLGQSQYHILNMGRCWFLLASLGWLEHSALWETQPNTKSLLARTPFLRWPRETLPPRTCSWT